MYFVGYSSIEIWLFIRVGDIGFREEDRNDQGSFSSYHIKGVYSQWDKSWSPDWGSVVRLFCCKVALSPPFHIVLLVCTHWQEVPVHTYTKEWGIMLPFLETTVFTYIIFNFSAQICLFFFICFCIWSFIDISMESCIFILCFNL